MHKFLLYFAAGILVGIFGVILWDKSHQNLLENRGLILREEGKYKFINPILACEIASKEAFSELGSMKNAVADLVEKEISSGKAENISVYFRALNTGRWFGVNEEDKYAPASLEKALIMIAYLKASESDAALLRKAISAENLLKYTSNDPVQNFEKGKSYTIMELVKKMVMDSSNPALNALLDNIDNPTLVVLKDIYSDLNLPPSSDLDLSKLDVMSPKVYSLIFRVLYGATYLNRENSERALEILSSASFKDGLVAGLPENMTVAHKFGIRNVVDEKSKQNKWELHDCGVVYYPNHPYLLCVMTKDDEITDLGSTISKISSLVHQEAEKFYK